MMIAHLYHFESQETILHASLHEWTKLTRDAEERTLGSATLIKQLYEWWRVLHGRSSLQGFVE
jgi:hypothetical protein